MAVIERVIATKQTKNENISFICIEEFRRKCTTDNAHVCVCMFMRANEWISTAVHLHLYELFNLQ